MGTLRMVLAALLIAAGGEANVAQDAAPAKVRLVPRWKMAESKRFRLVAETVAGPAGGQALATRTDTVYTEVMVANGDKGNFETEMAIESMLYGTGKSGEVKAVEIPKAVPDKVDATEISYAVMRAMLTHKFRLTYDAQGRLITVKGYDKMFAAAIKPFEGKLTPETQVVVAMLKELFNDTAAQRTLNAERFEYALPVAKGDTWQAERRINLPLGGWLVAEVKHKLDALDKAEGDTVARVSGEGTLTLAPRDKDAKASETEITIEEGKQTTETRFNVDRGIVERHTLRTSYRMIVKLKDGTEASRTDSVNTITAEWLPPKAEPAKGEK